MSGGRDLRESPSQTAGPYVHIGLTPNANGIAGVYAKDLGSSPDHSGTNMVKLDLRVLDGDGVPVTDALIEIWYADADGRYGLIGDDGEPVGWLRGVCADGDDAVHFEILKPGKTDAQSAPHVNLWLAARGINLALNSRVYFPDEDNAGDPVLQSIDEERRSTLIARQTDGGYALDIRLQGEAETVFFDI